MNREWTRTELYEPFDLYKRKGWFMDGVHTMPRWPALPLDHVWPLAERGLVWGCQRISIPQCKGWMWRTREGSAFLSPIIVTDENEIEEREEKFKQEIVPFIEDFHGHWGKYKAKWEEIRDKIQPFNVENASDIDLEDHYRELVYYEAENWKDHFYLMEGVGSLTLLFEDMARDFCGIDSSDPIWSKLTTGFESKAFESDARMWDLAKMAVDAKLKDTFVKYDGMELLESLKNDTKAVGFLKALDKYLDEYGYRLLQLLNYATPSWKERPDIALDRIRIFVLQDSSFRQSKVAANAKIEREVAEKELLAKVPVDQRDWFTTLMKAAQNWGWWSEEHEFWLNEFIYCMMRRVMLEYGKRFVKAGTFDQVDDIFHIREKDFERVLHHPEHFTLRPEVAKHRAEYAEFCKKESQPIVTYDGIPATMEWLAGLREFHVALSMGFMPVPKEGVNANLWGSCGSPGTVEGIARVVFSENQLTDIQEGDILIAPTTYVSWTPVFSLISGAVIDRGGSLSHSAICSREYGIPCVLNTFTGTSVIKTGQRIRVEADIGAVFVLD